MGNNMMNFEKLITEVIDSLLRHEITKRFAIIKIMAIGGKVTPKSLKERRLLLGLTQEELAKEVDISVNTIGRLETGIKIKISNVKKLNEFYLSKGV